MTASADPVPADEAMPNGAEMEQLQLFKNALCCN
jgi:hypothetical protein